MQSSASEQMPTEFLPLIKVVFGGQIARAPVIQVLQNAPGIELVVVDEVADVAKLAFNAEILVIPNPTAEEGQELARVISRPGCRVRWVQMVSAGCYGLTQHALPKTLLVTTHGGAVASTVAEHVMALLLAKTRALRSIYLAMEHRVWDSSLAMHTSSLEGRQMAIVGMGNVGRQLAIRASAFGMNVVGIAPESATGDMPWEIRPLQQLHTVLGSSDVVVVCLALTAQTRHLIDYPAFSAMKSGAVFINVSRGEVVDTIALRDALQTGRLNAAAIDSVEGETLDSKASLWDAPSLVISPHIAGSGGTFASTRIAAVLSENLMRYRQREPLAHLQSFI
jgi:phosphoglycerate dehydrogenase-like enzyme